MGASHCHYHSIPHKWIRVAHVRGAVWHDVNAILNDDSVLQVNADQIFVRHISKPFKCAQPHNLMRIARHAETMSVMIVDPMNRIG